MDKPKRKRTKRILKPAQLPLPPFSLTVQNIADAPVAIDKLEVRRLIWLNFTLEKAIEFEQYLHRRIAEHKAGYIGMEVEGTVKT